MKMMAAMVFVVIISSFSVKRFSAETLEINIPSNFPAPVYDFKNNPLTKEGFELGRKLFYDGSYQEPEIFHAVPVISRHLHLFRQIMI